MTTALESAGMMNYLLRVLSVVAVLMLWAMPAAAQVSKPIGEWEVTPGDSCVVPDPENESVWPGNVLRVVNGSEVLVVEGIEDSSRPGSEDAILSFVAETDVVTAFVDAEVWTSLEIEVVCSPPEPTTTTTEEPTTTTTSEVTTTTVLVDCAVVRGSEPEDCESTTITSDCSSFSQSDDCVTTTTTTPDPEPSTTTSTVPDPCDVEGACLPDTGTMSDVIALSGLALTFLGMILVMVRYGWGGAE